MAKLGLVVIAHGTVDSLDDLPAFLTNIRRGHAPPQELVDEVTRRYRAIGGRSPLNDTTREVASKLARVTGLPAAACGRLFAPYPDAAIAELVAQGVTDFVVVPLAQHSAPLYVEAVREIAKTAAPAATVTGPGNYGRDPHLVRAFAAKVDRALASLSPEDLSRTAVVWSAHSLPTAVVKAGDPYETEVRAAAAAIEATLARKPGRSALCFQSQGMSKGAGGRPVEWMGPTLEATLAELKEAGISRVIVAPVGFLADHVEILYDLDIEAKGWADAASIDFSRTESLNADDTFVAALASVISPLLAPNAEDTQGSR